MELVLNTDIHLVKRANSGERNAFNEIVETNKKKVFYLAYDLTGSTEDAEELSQEVFLKAYKSLKKFKGEASLSSWLYRITLNAFLDRKRKLSFRFEREKKQLDEYDGPVSHINENGAPLSINRKPEEYTESQQIQAHVDAALEHLTPKEKAVFVMRHYQGMPGKKVGELLSISEGTVKSLLFRAIKKLQQKLAHLNTTERSAEKEVCQ
jgi:RNA polymerase sigma-70 factor (ECF subfamily)